MNETYILKACPFCGSEPSQPIKQGGSDERNGYNFTISIKCGCGAAVVKHSSEGSGGWCRDRGQALENAVDTWNNRVNWFRRD